MKAFFQFFFFVTMRFPVGKKFSNISTNATIFLGLAESKHAVLQRVFTFRSEFAVSFYIIVGWVICQKKPHPLAKDH